MHTRLLKEFEMALLKDDGNLLHMRRAFYYNPAATPVLLKVVYNVTYGDNLLSTPIKRAIPKCANSTATSLIDFCQISYVYGWTSAGIFTVFHPIVLSMIQMQIPFIALKLVHLGLNQQTPEENTFHWYGFYDLPTLYLNIHITTLSCVPSQDMVEFILKDMTTLVNK